MIHDYRSIKITAAGWIHSGNATARANGRSAAQGPVTKHDIRALQRQSRLNPVVHQSASSPFAAVEQTAPTPAQTSNPHSTRGTA